MTPVVCRERGGSRKFEGEFRMGRDGWDHAKPVARARDAVTAEPEASAALFPILGAALAMFLLGDGGVAYAQTPDLVVGSVSVFDSSPATGASFTLSATVTNAGDGASASTTMRYYRSSDGTITTSDTQVATHAVGALAAGATSDESGGLTAPSTPGTYYYGACVDAVAGESDTTNNCSASVTVTVEEPAPDLVVLGPNVSDSSPETGGTFRLIVTVQNVGEMQAAATSMQYYRSTDATITTSDTAVGTEPVRALGVFQASAKTISLTAPSTAGRYYYGGCVDAVAGESDTTNNCSAPVQVDVSEPPPRPTSPDLMVGSPTVSDSSPATGASFTLSATVTNAGDGDSAATTLRYYRSSDATITTSDTEVATHAVGALAAGATSDESGGLTAPSTAGTYYYGACVDAVAGESDTTNNCSASVQVDVSEPPPPTSPDLVVDPPTVSDSGPAAGASFTLSAEVRNGGDGDSVATTLRYYESADATITASDTEVGTDAVGGLAASASGSQSVELTAPSTAGTYYYGACVDAVAGESDTTNNCSASVQVDVSEPPPPTSPDLVVDPPTVSDSGPAAGASFTLSAEVRNGGDGDSVATTLRYYESADATITASDTEVGTDAVGGLAASASSSQSVELTAPSTAGTYYYGACVDAVAGESDTSNNCSESLTVTVEEPAPDLVVLGPNVSDSSPETGGTFRLIVTVHNQGERQSEATTMQYYRSTDATITTSDTSVGTAPVSALGASQGSARTISLTAPSPAGTYYYGACVDAVAGESDTSNNCSTSVQVDVSQPVPALPLLAQLLLALGLGAVGMRLATRLRQR